MLNDAVRIFMAITALILVSMITSPLHSDLKPVVKNNDAGVVQTSPSLYERMDSLENRKDVPTSNLSGKSKKMIPSKSPKTLKPKNKSFKVAEKKFDKKTKKIKKS